MKSVSNVKPIVHKESSATYSINTTGKGIAKAQAAGDCMAQARGELEAKTLYVVQINESFRENSGAFETGLVNVSLHAWRLDDLFRNQYKEEKRSSFQFGFLSGLLVVILISGCVVLWRMLK